MLLLRSTGFNFIEEVELCVLEMILYLEILTDEEEDAKD